MKKNFLIIPFLLFSVSACAVFNFSKNYNEPSQVEKTVLLFAETYGTARMDETASITTADFRDGLPGSVWVAKVWPKLKAWEYQKLKTEILSTKIDGVKAIVIVQSKISTTGADAVQKEIYSLMRFQGRWLVDDLQVLEEDVEAVGREI